MGVWIHFQIRRGEIPQRTCESHEGGVYIYVDDEIIVEDLNGYRLTFGEFVS